MLKKILIAFIVGISFLTGAAYSLQSHGWNCKNVKADLLEITPLHKIERETCIDAAEHLNSLGYKSVRFDVEPLGSAQSGVKCFLYIESLYCDSVDLLDFYKEFAAEHGAIGE